MIAELKRAKAAIELLLSANYDVGGEHVSRNRPLLEASSGAVRDLEVLIAAIEHTNENAKDAFESAAFAHFGAKASSVPESDSGDGTPEALFWLDENGRYGVRAFNAAFWGWQAYAVNLTLLVNRLKGIPSESSH